MPGFSLRLRELLEHDAELIAATWLSALRERLSLPTERVFPDQTLLSHVPRLLRAIGEYLDRDEDPFERPEYLDELRRLALLRRAQGYGPDELVEEFDLLSHEVFERLAALACSLDPIPPSELLPPMNRLRHLLDRLSAVTVRVYRRELTSDYLERAQILTEFGRVISHELRNRLNSAGLAVHLLEQHLGPQRDAAPLSELLNKLSRSLQRAEHVVGDVFAVTLAREPRDPSSYAYEPLIKVIEEVLVDLEGFARDRGVTLSAIDVLDVHVDAAYARLVLVNLVSNAIKYCDPLKDSRWVRVRGSLQGSFLRVDVTDNGVGIPPEKQELVFERFVRANEDPRVDGQGIGLYTANQAAVRLGRHLTLSSIHGEGSTFSFHVPVPPTELD